jgi:hypothetical protein
MTSQTTRTALDAYMEHQIAAVALAQRIAAAIENNDLVPAPEQIRWGHVADISQIRAMLQEVSDCLFAEGEFAPESK